MVCLPGKRPTKCSLAMAREKSFSALWSWILGRPQTVYLDDVDVQPVSPPAVPHNQAHYGVVSHW